MRRTAWTISAVAVAGVGMAAVWLPTTGVAQPGPLVQPGSASAPAPSPGAASTAAVPASPATGPAPGLGPKPDPSAPRATKPAEPVAQPAASPPAADPALDPPPVPTVLRLYDVTDLTAGVATLLPFESKVVPPTAAGVPDYHGPTMGLFGNGDRASGPPTVGDFPASDLVNLLESELSAPDLEGGNVSHVSFVGPLLAVRHTAAGHQRTVELLAQLRAARPFGRGVEVVAHWVLLRPADAAALAGPPGRGVDPKALGALPPDALYARSSVRALTGQTVTLLAGRARTAVLDQNPQVGSAVAAFDPEVAQVLAGATVRLNVMVADDVATVGVQAAVGDWHDPGTPSRLRAIRSGVPTTVPTGFGEREGDNHVHVNPAAGDDAVAEIDRLNLTAFHLLTTARLTLGRPAVVGGMTLEPATGLAPGKGDPRQLYLVIEVNLADGRTPPRPEPPPPSRPTP